MRLEVLRWYDWLFIFLALLWAVLILDAIIKVGLSAIFFYALWLGYLLYFAIFYFPIYIGYKIYKWKKRKREI